MSDLSHQDLPEKAQPYRFQGIVALKQKQFDQAELSWKQALELDPHDSESLFYLLNLYQQRDPDKILPICKEFLFLAKPSKELYQFAGKLLLSKDLNLALDTYNQLWKLTPQFDWAFGLAKKLEKYNPDLAFTWYQRVYELEPKQTELLDHLGRLSFQTGQPNKALDYWQALCQMSPQARVLTNIASVQMLLKQFNSAQLSLEQALQIAPNLEPANYQMAMLALQVQDFELAIQYLPKIWSQYKQQLAEKILPIAITLMQSRFYILADRYFELCCDQDLILSKELHEIYAMRAACALSLIDIHKISQMYELAQQFAPHPLTYVWPKITSLPYIYQNHQHLKKTRLKFESDLDSLIAQVETELKKKEDLIPLLESARPPFLLAYQGLCNRAIMQKIGRVFTEILNKSNSIVRTEFQPQLGRAIRVGFISSFFYKHSVSNCYAQRIMEMAAKPDFDVTCIYLHSREDDITSQFRQSVQQFVQLIGDVSPQQISELGLDILIYLDIGMEPKTYQLAFHRLAPIQILISGHPETSGLPEMDYYLSSTWGEPENAQNHYTETLITLKENISTHIPAQNPDLVLSRSEIGFESDAHIYFCPMTLFKVHPDFDIAIGQILAQDPQGLVYFVQDSQPALAHALQTRFRETIPDQFERIRFVPWMDQTTFYSALLQADVVLDTFHFGGGTTSRMTLGLGVPLVCYPGQLYRARMTYSHYLRLGLEDYLPKNQQEYVQHALRLANDLTYRRHLKDLLDDLKPLVYEQGSEKHELYHVLRLMIESYPVKVTQQQVDAHLNSQGEK